MHTDCCVKTSYFPLLKSATKVKIGGTNLTVATNTLPLFEFQDLDWTKKSKFPLADKQSSPFLAVAGSIFCKHRLDGYYMIPHLHFRRA